MLEIIAHNLSKAGWVRAVSQPFILSGERSGLPTMESASYALFALKPVAFRYNKQIDPAGKRQLGLVAEMCKQSFQIWS